MQRWTDCGSLWGSVRPAQARTKWEKIRYLFCQPYYPHAVLS